MCKVIYRQRSLMPLETLELLIFHALSLVQVLPKALPEKTQPVLIPCPPHRIALLSKQDHQSKAEKMVCLRHHSSHKVSPVCPKTEPTRKHNGKNKDKCKLPPSHSDHHGAHIGPDLRHKTTASASGDLFQWGKEAMSHNQKLSSAVVPRDQAKAKHGPHPKVKHTSDSKQQTKPKHPTQHHPKTQATSLPIISQPGRTPSHCQSPTKYLLINIHPGPECQTAPTAPNPDPDGQTVPTTLKLMNIYPSPDGQTVPTTPKLMSTHHGPDCQTAPTTPKLMSIQRGPDGQTAPTTPKLMSTHHGPDGQTAPTTPKLMSTHRGPDGQTAPTTPKLMSTHRGPDGQTAPTTPKLMSTHRGQDGQTVPTTPKLMSIQRGPDGQTVPTTPKLMSTQHGPDGQTAPTTTKLVNTHHGPDCQTTPTIPRYEHHSKALPDPDTQDICPPRIYHQAQMLPYKDSGIFSILLSNQARDPINQYHQKMDPPSPIQQVESPVGDYNQAEGAPSSDQPDDSQPGNQHQTHTEQNRDTPIEPYTTEGVITLTTPIVDKIISSIPEEKIKRDIYNQVHLWQRRGCPRSTPWPRQYMSASYTICLICASWVPDGCPHVHGMKCSSLAQLLAIPTPLPDPEKKSVRFYLKVPQQKPNTISTITDSLSTKAMPSNPSPAFPSCPKANSDPLVLPKPTWLDFILAKRHQPKEEKSWSGQKPWESPLTSETSMEEEMPVRKRAQFKSLLEKFLSRRGN
ncbi:uncharacterized protein [Notamacropus eugenii]